MEGVFPINSFIISLELGFIQIQLVEDHGIQMHLAKSFNPSIVQKMLWLPLTHWFKHVYATPEKMSAAFPILKLYNFNISIL